MIKRRRVMFGSLNEDSLPSGFVELEYLESSGHQAINTNYIPKLSQSDSFILEFSFTNVSGTTIVFGTSDYRYTGNRSIQLPCLSGNLRADFCSIQGFDYFGSVVTNKDYVLQIKNGVAGIDSLREFSVNPRTPNNQSQLVLFAQDSNGGDGAKVRVKKAVYITETGGFRMVPALYKNGKPGLYDFRTNDFRVNSGSGEFGYLTKSGVYVSPL